MNNTNSLLKINRHEFQTCKNRIQNFAKQTPKRVNLSTVDTSTLCIFDHRVTGAELNNLVSEIQDSFIKFNDNIRSLTKEFEEVYLTLDILDRDYIDSIVLAIKGIEKTNDKLRETIDTLRLAVDKLDETTLKTSKRLDAIDRNQEYFDNCIKNIVDSQNTVADNLSQIVRFQNGLSDNINKIVKSTNELSADLHKMKCFEDSIANQIDKVVSSQAIVQTKMSDMESHLKEYGCEIDKLNTVQTLFNEKIEEIICSLEKYNNLLGLDEQIRTCAEHGKKLAAENAELKQELLEMEKSNTLLKAELEDRIQILNNDNHILSDSLKRIYTVGGISIIVLFSLIAFLYIK